MRRAFRTASCNDWYGLRTKPGGGLWFPQSLQFTEPCLVCGLVPGGQPAGRFAPVVQPDAPWEPPGLGLDPVVVVVVPGGELREARHAEGVELLDQCGAATLDLAESVGAVHRR